MQKSQNEGAPTGQSQHALVEEVLLRNIREVPIARRYAAVTQKADDLWNLLDGLPSDDKEYTILVAARFQRELETELKGLEIPQKTIDLGPRHISKDGTQYYMATRSASSAALTRAPMRERRFRERTRLSLSFPFAFSLEGVQGDFLFFASAFFEADAGLLITFMFLFSACTAYMASAENSPRLAQTGKIFSPRTVKKFIFEFGACQIM